MRFRNAFLGLGGFLTILVLLMSDPDGGLVHHLPFGASTLNGLILLITSLLYVGVLHLSRRALFDYLDLQSVIKKAMQTPEGSGMVVIGIGLAMISISVVIYAAISK